MADIPKYDYQVAPGGRYAGPTAMQIGSLFGATQQKIGIIGQTTQRLLGAGEKLFTVFINQQIKIQQAYENAQLSKAKAGYFATMKRFAEELPYSDIAVERWQDEYQGKAQEVLGEVLEKLEPSARQYLFGGPQQATILDDFEAWRIEQDAAFESVVLENQRLKMTDELKESVSLGLTMVRQDPSYLKNFISDIQRNIEANIISGQYGGDLIEKAKQIASMSALYSHAQNLGLDAGAAFLADNANLDNVPAEILPEGVDFLTLDDTSKDRVRRDFDVWAGQIRSFAEQKGDKEASQAEREFIEEFFTGRVVQNEDGTTDVMRLTLDRLRSDTRLVHDPNAPRANARKDQIYERFSTMLLARIDAANIGVEDPAGIRDQGLYNSYVQMAHDDNLSTEDFNAALEPSLGKGIPGQDYNTLKNMKQSEAPTRALKTAEDRLMGAAQIGGLMTLKEASDAYSGLTNLLTNRQNQVSGYTDETGRWVPPVPGAKLYTDEEIVEFVDNVLFEATQLQWDNVTKNMGKIPEAMRKEHEIWLEAEETRFYKRRGRGLFGGGRGVKNIDAHLWLIQEGKYFGNVDTPSAQARIKAARPVFDASFQEWTQINPKSVLVQTLPSGRTVYGVMRDLAAEGLGEGVIETLYTMYYDEDKDAIFWAHYNPYTRAVTPLIDERGNQINFQDVKNIEFRHWETQRYQPGSSYFERR